MPRIRIADLLASTPGDPETHLCPVLVGRYARMLDFLSPAVVFETPEGLLLSTATIAWPPRDGWGWSISRRRCAAARD